MHVTMNKIVTKIEVVFSKIFIENSVLNFSKDLILSLINLWYFTTITQKFSVFS